MNKDVLYIGMDLGASKTAIVASNGRRESFRSIVGWPKDAVARGCLGRDVLFGQEVLDNRLALRVLRPFEKGMLKWTDPNETDLSPERIEETKDAARLLVQHAAQLASPEPVGRLRGVIGVPSRASLVNQKLILDAAHSVFDEVLIIPEPFAVAYGMDEVQNTLVVDIGASTIDICPMCGSFPSVEEQQTVPFGGDNLDEAFHRRMSEIHPSAQLSTNMAREIKERYGFIQEPKEKVVVFLPTDRKQQEFDITEPLRSACQLILEPLLQGIRDVAARVDPEFRSKIMGNILLSGGGSQLRGLDRAIETAIRTFTDVRVTRVYDTLFAGAAGAFKLATAMTGDQWDSLCRVQVETTPKPRAKSALPAKVA